tara:strand:+ start:111175 stop:111312 length:138 start_codon:yes stop_codon:yes gene_type:complete
MIVENSNHTGRWQREVERTAFAGLGFEPDSAFVGVDDFLDDGEPD